MKCCRGLSDVHIGSSSSRNNVKNRFNASRHLVRLFVDVYKMFPKEHECINRVSFFVMYTFYVFKYLQRTYIQVVENERQRTGIRT